MKKIVMACGLFVLGVLAVGCGKNKCETAADDILGKAEECGLTTEDGSSSEGSSGECTEEAGKAAECLAGCYTAASCETLKGEDVEGAGKYAECIGGC